MQELLRSDLGPLEIYTAVIGDGILDLMDAGKVKGMSASGLYFSSKGFERFWGDLKRYKDLILLRPVEIADCSEVILRLGVIAINGALEVDIYGHVNSTHAQGSQIITGIGGSGEFAQNAVLSIFVLPASRNAERISTIVPMVTHVDHTEHSVDVVVTEQGVADLRGLDPIEKADQIIGNCAHPDFRPYLRKYLERAKKENVGHEPHLLKEAFSLHLNFLERGTMKE
jgi:acyl-CoA hydrolase